MRDYEHLPAAQRNLVEQLDEEDRKREERERELEAILGEVREMFSWVEEIKEEVDPKTEIGKYADDIDTSLCNVEENLVDILNKYN